MADIFEEATRICGQPKKVSNWLMGETQRLLKERNMDAEDIEDSLRVDDSEKELIQRALELTKGNRKEAAARLGRSERTLYRKIKEYGLE